MTGPPVTKRAGNRRGASPQIFHLVEHRPLIRSAQPSTREARRIAGDFAVEHDSEIAEHNWEIALEIQELRRIQRPFGSIFWLLEEQIGRLQDQIARCT
jgi:hypothetical protein